MASEKPLPTGLDLSHPHLRKSVMRFAYAIEARLRAGAHEGDRAAVRATDPFEFATRLRERTTELEREVTTLSFLSNPRVRDGVREQILREAADVGAFAMMAADACDALGGLGDGDE